MRLWLDGHKRIDLWPNRGPGPYPLAAAFTHEPPPHRLEMNPVQAPTNPPASVR